MMVVTTDARSRSFPWQFIASEGNVTLDRFVAGSDISATQALLGNVICTVQMSGIEENLEPSSR
jgi:hypothetical protein